MICRFKHHRFGAYRSARLKNIRQIPIPYNNKMQKHKKIQIFPVGTFKGLRKGRTFFGGYGICGHRSREYIMR